MTYKFLQLYELLSPAEREELKGQLRFEGSSMSQRALLLLAQADAPGAASSGDDFVRRFELPGLPGGELRKLMSFLTSRIRQMICQAALLRDDALLQTLFLQELNRRNLAKGFDKYYKDAQRVLDEASLSQDRTRLTYEQELAAHRLRMKFQAAKPADAPLRLMQAAEAYWELLTFQFAAMMSSICQKRGLPLPHLVGAAASLQAPGSSALAEAYRTALRLLQQNHEPDADALARQLSLLAKAGAAREEQANLFYTLLNWRIGQYKRNPSQTQAGYLANIYLWAEQAGLLLDEGLLPFQHAHNLLTALMRAGREEEAVAQAHRIAPLLSPELREEVPRFYEALAAFLRSDYAAAARQFGLRFRQPLLEAAARLYGWQILASSPEEEPDSVRRRLESIISRWDRPASRTQRDAVYPYLMRAKACRLLFEKQPASSLIRQLQEKFPREALWQDSWLWKEMEKRHRISRSEVYTT